MLMTAHTATDRARRVRCCGPRHCFAASTIAKQPDASAPCRWARATLFNATKAKIENAAKILGHLVLKAEADLEE
jgi:hypothetical protein